MVQRRALTLPVELSIVGAAAVVALVAGPFVAASPPHGGAPYAYGWLDVVLTLVAATAVVGRRWHLAPAFWVSVAASAIAQASGHPLNLAPFAPAALAFSLALHRERRTVMVSAAGATVVLLGASLAGALWGAPWWGKPGEGFLWLWIGTAIGLAARSQRLMVEALEQRAERAEAANDELALRLVAEDRVRIARELHDVMAHHVSVINVQAGVAGHLLRSDPATAETSIGHIRAAASTVLDELQGILGVLRQDESLVPSVAAPAPTDLADTFDAARTLGVPLTVTGPTGLDGVAPLAAHAAHRLVQEALTNARKHAPGSPVSVVIRRGDTLSIEISNPVPPGERQQGPSSGFGLMGMRERVLAAGGTLTITHDPGLFVVTAELPVLREDS
ncbi:MAG TPA: histidine kinase [Arachnia sp.]|nr:histidine kinase [Arachnia sp.]